MNRRFSSRRRLAIAAAVSASILAVPVAQAAPGGNNGTPPEHAGPEGGPPGQAAIPEPAPPKPEPSPPAHSNAGGNSGAGAPAQSSAGGNGGGPPAHSSAGGNPSPGPPAHSSAGGNSGKASSKGNGPPEHSNAGGQNKVTICHSTGSATNPYVEITVAEPALKAHGEHHDHGDIIPAPAGGCPGDEGGSETAKEHGPSELAPKEHGNEKVTICHATGSETNPYVVITISVNALPAHLGNHGDIYPVPAEGCPGSGTAAAGESPENANENEKVTICHATGSETNPYVVITISVNALPAHLGNHGDIYPVPEGGCPGENTLAAGAGGEELVRLCHATGDASNPYDVLTVPASEVPEHVAHGDIVGVPPEGCPGGAVLGEQAVGGSGDDENPQGGVLGESASGGSDEAGFDESGASTSADSADEEDDGGTLPFTGLDLLVLATIGGLLLLLGWRLRRRGALGS